MKCKICQSATSHFGEAKVINKYVAKYLRCDVCGFVQITNSDWIDEAYANPIVQSDVGIVSRNLATASTTGLLIHSCFPQANSFVDYGGGYGLFVRLMRDRGFNFYRQDAYCDNLLARGFDAETNGEAQYDLLTAFEVFEHLIEPIVEIQKMLTFSRSIFFSTLLIPNPTPKLNEWWYYGLEHGQHVSLYTLPALKHIASRFKLNLISNGNSLHLLTEQKVSALLFRLICHARLARLMKLVVSLHSSRKSLLADDYFELTGKRI